MSTITPHLWFDTRAGEAAAFYASVFPESSVDSHTVLHGTPDGDTEVVRFTVWGQEFMAISAGPAFQPNPSISFTVNVDPTFTVPAIVGTGAAVNPSNGTDTPALVRTNDAYPTFDPVTCTLTT